MRDGYRFKETEILRECSVPVRLLAHRFRLCPGQDSLLVAGGSTTGIVIVFCQRSGLLFKQLDASQRVMAVRKQMVLQRRFLGKKIDLVRANRSFPENSETKL